jgi:peptidoglycan/LPS O-acetylase OafA/YrhL
MTTSRQRARYVGATFAAGMALIYFLIGLGVLDVGGTTDGNTDIFAFGMMAGAGFLVWAVLLVLVDRRWLWAIGVLFQLLVYAMYVGVSGTREPPFENWGVTLRIVQVPLLLAMIYLTLHAPERTQQTA